MVIFQAVDLSISESSLILRQEKNAIASKGIAIGTGAEAGYGFRIPKRLDFRW